MRTRLGRKSGRRVRPWRRSPWPAARSPRSHTKRSQIAMKHAKNFTGRQRGSRGFSQRGKTGSEMARDGGRAVVPSSVDGGSRRPRCGSSSGTGDAIGSGERQQGCAWRVTAPICSGRGTGRRAHIWKWSSGSCCLDWRGASGCERRGMALMGGARASAPEEERNEARRQLPGPSWAGGACWAERGARLGWRLARRKKTAGQRSWANRPK